MFSDGLRGNLMFYSPTKINNGEKPSLENCQKKLDFEDNILSSESMIFVENDSIDGNREKNLFFESSQNSISSLRENPESIRPFSQDFSEKANIKDTISRRGSKQTPFQYILDDRKTIKKQDSSNLLIEEESEMLSETERDDNNYRNEEQAFTRMV